MKALKISLAALALSVLFAPSALAGSISNTIRHRNTSAKYDLNVNTESVRNFTEVQKQRFVKIDAVGENAGANLTYSGGHIYGSGFATNVENPDPFVVIGENTIKTVTTGSDETTTRYGEWGTYQESEVEYRLGAD